MAKQRPGFIIAGEPDTERTKCHTACACRKAKVEELVEAASEHLRHHCVAPERECEDCDRLEAAIEGVKE